MAENYKLYTSKLEGSAAAEYNSKSFFPSSITSISFKDCLTFLVLFRSEKWLPKL